MYMYFVTSSTIIFLIDQNSRNTHIYNIIYIYIHGRPQLFWKGGGGARIGQGGAILRCPLPTDSTSGGGGGADVHFCTFGRFNQ